MGRPLNDKYFGNRNTGSASTTADNGIGGTAVASVTLNALGAYTTRPTITFSDPDLLAEGGVRATGTITSEVESVTAVGGTQTGYTVGQLVTVTGTDAVLRVATIGGTGGDDALTFDFTGGSRGNFTTLPSGAQNTTSNGAGTGLTVTLRFRAKAVVITEQGSGYSHATDATATFTQSVTATSVNMLVDSGIVGTAGNQENAINMTAYLTGGSSGNVDIKKQVSTNRYKVTDGTRTGIVKLQASAVSAAGQATIVATDATGCTYYVTKLTAHKATLTRFGGGSYEFATGAAVPWTMNGTSGTKAYSNQPYLATGVNVQIANV
jgi:hypothetical protein